MLACAGGEAPTEPTSAPVATVAVAIPRAMIRVGETLQAGASARDETGEILNGRAVTWSSSATAIASVTDSGLVTAVSPGVVEIRASVEGKTGQATLTVTIIPIASIDVSPTTTNVFVGQLTVLSASPRDSSGKPLSGRILSWSSSDETRAVVTAQGVAVGVQPGLVDISVAAEGKAGSSRVQVLSPELAVASITVTVARTAFRVGESVQAAAFPLDSSGGVLTGRRIEWSCSDPSVATITSSGLITAVSPGTASIVARSGSGVTSSVTVITSLIPVASVTISPSAQGVSAGASVALSAILKDSADRLLTGRFINWTSSNPGVAAVSTDGEVVGILVGTAEITATAEGKTGRSTISVNTLNTPVATITIAPANSRVSGGATKQLTPSFRDTNGNVLTGRAVSWSSSNPDRATVSPSGLVTASPVDAPVVITATVDGRSATASIEIITFVRMSTGGFSSCGLTAAGSAYCWGFGSDANPTKVPTDVRFISITSGNFHHCAFTELGIAYCWGDNGSGELGSGSFGPRSPVPVPVAGGYRFVSLAAGSSATCGTTSERDVYCWGRMWGTDDLYQSFNPQNTAQPRYVGGDMVAVVAGGDGGFCSINLAGLVYCWELEYLYRNSLRTTLPPIRGPVSTTHFFTTVRRGNGHACGIVVSGQAFCWGKNESGQLGDGTTVAKGPTLVGGGLLFETLAPGGGTVFVNGSPLPTGGNFTCGMTLGGKAHCWGGNAAGQLGTSIQSVSVLTPQPVADGITFTGLRSGWLHTCGIAVGGAALCWGDNSRGQYGDGSRVSARKPSPVFGR